MRPGYPPPCATAQTSSKGMAAATTGGAALTCIAVWLNAEHVAASEGWISPLVLGGRQNLIASEQSARAGSGALRRHFAQLRITNIAKRRKTIVLGRCGSAPARRALSRSYC